MGQDSCRGRKKGHDSPDKVASCRQNLCPCRSRLRPLSPPAALIPSWIVPNYMRTHLCVPDWAPTKPKQGERKSICYAASVTLNLAWCLAGPGSVSADRHRSITHYTPRYVPGHLYCHPSHGGELGTQREPAPPSLPLRNWFAQARCNVFFFPTTRRDDFFAVSWPSSCHQKHPILPSPHPAPRDLNLTLRPAESKLNGECGCSLL